MTEATARSSGRHRRGFPAAAERLVDARSHGDAVDGFEAARELGPVVELADDDLGRRDLRGRRRREYRGRFADAVTGK